MNGKLLTKSKYLNGLQCPRYLWVACNKPDSIPEPGLAQRHIFDQGHMVGNLAKKLFPGGTEVPTNNFMENIMTTKSLLGRRKPIYEAGMMAERLYSRIDMLMPAGPDAWNIVEVKSSTSLKTENVDDVSFQKYCCEEGGLKIKGCFLVHINNEFVKNGEIRPEQLFTVLDISEQIAEKSEGIRDRTNKMLEIIDSKHSPRPDIGPRCRSPFDCPLMDTDCWSGLPEHNVFTLVRGGETSHRLFLQGVIDIADIPTDYELSDKQRIQYGCVTNGTPHVNAKPVKEFLSTLRYPRYFFDFETFATAIPLFDGTRPYQNIPFQYSLHVLLCRDSFTMHFGFLAEGTGDPRPELLKTLKPELGNGGSIVVYNQSFEKNVLQELGEAFPEHKNWSDGAASRLVDLLIPFRNFHYYHPSQRGSASIKHVLPTLTGQGYGELDIGKGNEASVRYFNAVYGKVSPEERARTRTALTEYCGLDTKGMVDIVRRLEEITK